MAGYERFSKLASDKVIPVIQRIDKKELEQSVRDSIDGITRKPKRPNLTKEEAFYVKIHRHFGEINTSLETLEHIPVFIDSYRKQKAYCEAGITDTIHLRYHIEHYLQENYILLSRGNTFMGWLSNILKSEGRTRESKLVSKLREIFEKYMENLKLVRGGHVHKTRYDDNLLNMATILELVGQDKRDEGLEVGAAMFYRIAKKEWSERIIKSNQDLKRSLDVIFECLIPIVFPSARE